MKKYPGVGLLAAVVIGIVLADQCHWPAEMFLILSLVAAAAGLFWQNQWQIATALLAISLGSFAGFHFAIGQYDCGPAHLSHHFQDNDLSTCYGLVSDWPIIKPQGTEIVVSLDSIKSRGPVVSVRGSVLLKVSDSTTALQWGDRVAFTGRLREISSRSWPTGFDYQRYLNLRGVQAVVYMTSVNDVLLSRDYRGWSHRQVERLRLWITATFQRHLEPTSAALASGFLIGQTRDIPSSVYQAFRDSGTLHLLAVSGSNVALVVLFFSFVLRPLGLPRLFRSLSLIGLIVLFALVCYGEPSVVRAALMAALVISSGVVQRRIDLNNIIAITALTILLVDPAQLFHVGFQLSFATAWGLIFSLPVLVKHLPLKGHRRWVAWLVMPLLVTCVAQLYSAPLTAYYFQRVPLISPVANLVVVPAVSMAVVGSLIFLVLAAISSTLASLGGWLLNQFLEFVLWSVNWFGDDTDLIFRYAPDSPWLVVLCLAFLAMATFSVVHKRLRAFLVIVPLLAVNLVLIACLPPFQERSCATEICLFGVPGGLVAVVTTDQSSVADMIVTDAISRRYPIDERILDPALRRLGVERLHRVMVMGADFGALDDILRTSVRFGAGSIEFPRELRASMLDAARLADVPLDTSCLSPVGWSGPVAEVDTTGYFLFDGGVLVSTPGLEILVSASPDWPPTDRKGDKPRLWVTDSYQSPTKALRQKLIRDRIEVLVCSGISGPRQGKSAPSSDFSALRAIYSLRELGAVRISTYADSLHSFEVAPSN